jgi:hypothetical protein
MIHDNDSEVVTNGSRTTLVAALRHGVVAGAILCAASCGGMESEPAADTTSGGALAPFVAENRDLRIAAAPDTAATVSVRSRRFADLADLYRFAVDQMGGAPIRDATGEIIGVRGVSIASGDITYRDEATGESFKAADLAQAFLGGAAGNIEIGGEVQKIRELAPSDSKALGDFTVATAALSGDSSQCVGGDCITGHSWKSDYIVYHSVGSETQQSSGGYGTTTYPCCTSGTPVTYQGRLQCRVVTEFEPADPENGIYKPIPVAYGYRDPQTCSSTTTINTLTLAVTAILPSGFVGGTTVRSEANSRDVTLSNWAVGTGVSFLGIDDVAGVCGLHTGSRGGTSRTRAGSATDAQCSAPVTTALQATTASPVTSVAPQ